MKIYSKKNVLEMAEERINYLFDEFPNVVVGFSGGKDSTVIFNLCLKIAKEKNRLPLNVLWIDQEAEWKSTVNFVKKIMLRNDVKPYWFQMPMVITNNASSFFRYNYCWDENEKDKWIHPKHEISKKENIYNSKRFHRLFRAIFKEEFKDLKTCYISGVRCAESPGRQIGLTQNITYKWITWGCILNKEMEHYTFYPIYDWSFTDVWKYIFDNNLEYNKLYDHLFQYNFPLAQMRVSCIHHETSIQWLMIAHEIEPDTWQKVTNRISGSNTINILTDKAFKYSYELPFMFTDWHEYALYLAENLIMDEKNKKKILYSLNNYRGKGNRDYSKAGPKLKEDFCKQVINTILSNDWDYTKIANWESSPMVNAWRTFMKKKLITRKNKDNKYIVEML
jgi:predicted phosphoadenosine phosphosulfate sulfurtransferase